MSITGKFERIRSSVLSFAHDGRRSGALMLAAAILGLVLANLPATTRGYSALSGFRLEVPLPGLTIDISDWCRDGLLSVFFLVVGLDLKCELTTGSLSHVRDALVPVLAAAGGVLVPILVYLAINVGSSSTLMGWTVPTATDIAFSVAVLEMAGGTDASRLAPFLTTLAVADDVIGILLIAIVYSHGGKPWAFALLVLCLLSWYGLTRLRKTPWPLAIPVALGTWYLTLLAGIHPTIAGVALGLLVPGRAVHGETRARAKRWSNVIGPFSSLLALPVFAFFAMGVQLHAMGINTFTSPVFLGVFLGLVIGKPIGITLVTGICRLCGLAPRHSARTHAEKDAGMPLETRLQNMGVAQLCGIGFTVAFLMADLAFTDSTQAGIAKTAVLTGSIVAALIGSMELLVAKHMEQTGKQ